MVLTTIKLSQAGLSPPVFLAGTFTQWEATIEMDHDAVFGSSRDQHQFSKVVDIEPGEHQFKFRLGHGDWWIVDEGAPTATDALGNVNNMIQVVDDGMKEEKVIGVNDQKLPVQEHIPAREIAVKEEAIKSEKAEPLKDGVPTPKVAITQSTEPKQAAPAAEPLPVRKVPSKETFESKKTAPSELTAVDQHETSSAQSILREPATTPTSQQEILSSKHQQEPLTNGAAPKLNGSATKMNGSAVKTNGVKPAKEPSKSFVSKLLCCFTGKTAIGAAAVSALLVAVYIRR